MFGGSSQDVFCAVSFFRAGPTSSHTTKIVFVFRKARVAPRKALLVPKLEPQDALLANPLKEITLKGLLLKLTDVYLWTDSTTVLQ